MGLRENCIGDVMGFKNITKKTVRPLVDRLVHVQGDNGLTNYIRLVNKCLPKSNALTEGIRHSLLAIPSISDLEVLIKTDEITFSYHSNEYDDLNQLCRNGLGNWEPLSRAFFFEWSKNCHSIIDIGAYSGVYSILGLLSNPNAHVYAFEPNPKMHGLLLHNLALNNIEHRASVSTSALSDDTGSADFFLGNEINSSSSASLISQDLDADRIQVKTLRLDDALPNANIDLIKIDVEGFEPRVFHGGENLLSRNSAVIISEALTDSDLRAQSEILSEIGYQVPIPVDPNNPLNGDGRNFIWTKKTEYLKVVNMLESLRNR